MKFIVNGEHTNKCFSVINVQQNKIKIVRPLFPTNPSPPFFIGNECYSMIQLKAEVHFNTC